MTVLYVTEDLVQWGAGEGRLLTPAEIDENFWTLKNAVDSLTGGLIAPAEIASITRSGSQLTITLDDASSYTVTVPYAHFTWAGDWAASTGYLGMDLVRVAGAGIYLVRYAHTSDTTFDPAFVAPGETEAAYVQMFEFSGNTVTDVSGTTHGPTAAISIGLFRCSNAAGCAVTIPAESTEDFAAGSRLEFVQAAAGAVTLAVAGGVTLNTPPGFSAETRGQGAKVAAVKVGADEWDLYGELARDYVLHASYTVATLPSASTAGAGAMIYVSDETGGAVPAFSDGTDWRRATDRAVVS